MAPGQVKVQPPPVPALRVRSFDSLQQQAMIPVQQTGTSAAVTRAPIPPMGPAAALAYQQQQQQYQFQQQQRQIQQPGAVPHALQQPALLPQAAIGMEHRSAPLAAALHNADCIRTGIKSPWVGGWTGCQAGPWCNLEPEHVGACNTRATIPGLSAYLPEELAAVGLPAVVELSAPLPPAAAAAALAAATAAAAAVGGSSAAAAVGATSTGNDGGLKRKVDSAPAPAAANSEGGSLTASDNHSNNGDEAVQQEIKAATRTSKRKKSSAAIESDDLHEILDGAGTDNEAVSEELKSSMTGEAKLRVVAPTPPRKGGRSRGRKAGAAARAMHAAESAPTTRDAAGAEDLGSSGAAIPAPVAEKPAHRPVGRRAPQQWISGEAVDPRTGKKVTVVPPATFCTQCSATSTPVWRAGPFGHKTLCNACGVRWMKVAPRARK